MRPREYALVLVSAISAAVCIRLGIWQLNRLHERRLYNTALIARLSEPAVSPAALPTHDTAAIHFRRVTLRGAYDYAHEFVLASRSRQGSPGVNIITPVRIAGDTAVLVNRGWIYAPDGMTADLSRWREMDTVAGIGLVVPFGPHRNVPAQSPTRPNAYRWIDATTIRSIVPYAVHPYVIILEGDTVNHRGVPPRVPPPDLDEGPHQSYAIQWFAFATIAIVGGALFYLRMRRPAISTTSNEGS